MKITNLKINGMLNPVGYSYNKIIASWKVQDTDAKNQTNVLIEVSDSSDFETLLMQIEGPDLDSVETELDLALAPYTRYYWRVSVTGNNGEVGISEPGFFETGKMDDEWNAQWISPQAGDNCHPVLFKHFSLGKKVAKARIYVCGLGLYEAYLNDKQVGNEYLAPYLNDYLECYQYQTYDVTDMLSVDNQIEILLGKGWYMGVFGLQNQPNLYGDQMKAIAELHIWYEDGSTEVVSTDDSWLYQGSDIEESGIYYGETINHLMWENKDNQPKSVVVSDAPGNLVERYSIPVVAKEELVPIEIITTPAGETVVDFGQNHAGYMEFYADFPKGTKIVMECGEVLQEDNFYRDNYREAESAFTYISDGRKELVRPHFTYFGYRYLKVTGWSGELKTEDICSKVIYSDLERIGYIDTSNEKINRLYQNCLWGLKSNFVDIPTDCPQRNERLGWTGDAQVFAPTASYHMDTRAFYRKFLTDLRFDQVRGNGAIPNYIPSLGAFGGCSNVWGDAATFIPDTLFNMYGNKADTLEYYPLMRDWVEFLYNKDQQTGGSRLIKGGFQFGDWLALDGVTDESFKGSTDDDYIGSIYYCKSVQILAEMAQRLGFASDAARYIKIAEEIKKAVLDEYFAPSGRISVDTQAAYIAALKFGIYRDKEKLIQQFKERLKKDCYKIKCGFVGAPLLCVTLCENGMEDLAYHFLFQEGFPSWLYAVNLGATTIWERWNSIMPDGSISKTGMNSLNHYSYGSVVEFFYAYIAGLRAVEPGFRKAVIAPNPDMRFRYFNCRYDSVCGTYVSNWKIEEDGRFVLHVEVPFGCTAEVVLPRYYKEESKITLTAGAYDFSYMPSKDYRLRYDENTRLEEVAKDEAVMEILKAELPVAYGIIVSGDKENGSRTFGELKHLFFMGFTPESVEKVTSKIFAMKKW